MYDLVWKMQILEGLEGQKSSKKDDFAIFFLARGVCGAEPPTGGGPNAPCPPDVPTAFFPEKYQTLHDLSLANGMHGNEMIIIDS